MPRQGIVIPIVVRGAVTEHVGDCMFFYEGHGIVNFGLIAQHDGRKGAYEESLCAIHIRLAGRTVLRIQRGDKAVCEFVQHGDDIVVCLGGYEIWPHQVVRLQPRHEIVLVAGVSGGFVKGCPYGQSLYRRRRAVWVLCQHRAQRYVQEYRETRLGYKRSIEGIQDRDRCAVRRGRCDCR